MNICSPRRHPSGLPDPGRMVSASLSVLQIYSDGGIRIAGHMIAAQAALQGEILRYLSGRGPGENVALRQIQDHSQQALCEAAALTQRLQAHWAAMLDPTPAVLPRETGSGLSG